MSDMLIKKIDCSLQIYHVYMKQVFEASVINIILKKGQAMKYFFKLVIINLIIPLPMLPSPTIAQLIKSQDSNTISNLTHTIIKPLSNNFVERPWAGSSMMTYKGYASSTKRIGEAFEIAAYPKSKDAESSQYPSIIQFQDGSQLTLLELLEYAGQAILGDAFIAVYGKEIPLLPKTLNIGQLLSVQSHPEGNTELYVIIKAEQGATLYVGFKENIINAEELKRKVADGRQLQTELLNILGNSIKQEALHAILSSYFAQPTLDIDAATAEIQHSTQIINPSLKPIIEKLHTLYWDFLNLMNEIPVAAGDIINNATPQRITAITGKPASAEVHALGNPEGKEILALEIRKPGVTYRLWDNVRFPLRPLTIDESLVALNLLAIDPQELKVTLKPDEHQVGIYYSVQDDFIKINHIKLHKNEHVEITDFNMPHILLSIAGSAHIINEKYQTTSTLSQGESALVPVVLERYAIQALDETEIVQIIFQ